LGISVTVADILFRRGHRDLEQLQRFLQPRLADLTPPWAMADRELAAERLARALRAGERVCVFGDYDCDGITSAALVTEALVALGGDAVTLLASRFDGGYGVSAAAAARIVESGASLLVACDCGSSDHEILARIRQQGLDVIVIDHHVVPDQSLPATAFLNPHRPDCGFPFKHLASCGLALSVVAALRTAVGGKLDLREWLDLVAIGTVADVVPLSGDNRALVRAGLERLRRPSRPGVRALLELAKVDGGAALTGDDIAFRIAPRINAPGRLGPPDVALQLLLARSDEAARALAARVDQLTGQRRSQQERILAEAVDQIERQAWAGRPAIVVGQQGWNHGVVGIVASRLKDRYGCPVVAIGFDQSGTGRGSARGPAGSRLHDALQACAGALERYGGHQAAAGLEVRQERLQELRERFESACARELAGGADAGEQEGEGPVRLDPDDRHGQVLADLEQLEPCGKGNPTPQILVVGELVAARTVRGGHLKLELALAHGQRLAAFGPGLGARADGLAGRLAIVGTLRRDLWRGGDAAELRISRILA
jgi:single-stranded-DNA-specific exonuclease